MESSVPALRCLCGLLFKVQMWDSGFSLEAKDGLDRLLRCPRLGISHVFCRFVAMPILWVERRLARSGPQICSRSGTGAVPGATIGALPTSRDQASRSSFLRVLPDFGGGPRRARS